MMEVNQVMRKAMILMAVCAVAAVGAPRAFASCGFAVPLANLGNAPIVHCPDGQPVSGYAYAADNGAINTGTLDIVCEATNGTSCIQPSSDAPGAVTIETDWLNPGMNGCIVGHRAIIILQCNDGTGLKLSLSGADGTFGYQVEVAYDYDAATDTLSSPDLRPGGGTTPPRYNNGRPQVLGLTRSGGTDNLQVNVPVPDVLDDCRAGSLGGFLDSQGIAILNCATAPPAAPARGRLFSSTQPCSGKPLTALASWTLVTATPAAGPFSVPLPTPAAGQCSYLGTTSNVGGVDSGTIDGWVAVGDPSASKPVAEGLRGAKNGNTVSINFTTSSELGLAGFNILTDGKGGKGEMKLNSSLVAAKGIGGAGASYSLSFQVGDFKGGRSVTVESVMTDGTTVRSQKINF